MPDVSIVIVSWNVRDLLRECLKSILNSPDVRIAGHQGSPNAVECEVIVVDSNSTDGTGKMVSDEFPWAILVQETENVGFSAGNNLGFHRSRARHILFLNPDTHILGNAISTLAEYLDLHTEVAAIGPKLLNSDETIQSSRRRFPTIRTGFFESTLLEPIAPSKVLRNYYMQDCDPEIVHDVDWLVGAAIMVRRSVLDKVGTFDERFFMYSEEIDLQKRIKEGGWNIRYLPSAEIIHHGGKSSDQVVAQRHILFETSKITYFRKHHGDLAADWLRRFLLASYGWKLAFEKAKALLGHKREMRMQRVKAYSDVLRSELKG